MASNTRGREKAPKNLKTFVINILDFRDVEYKEGKYEKVDYSRCVEKVENDLKAIEDAGTGGSYRELWFQMLWNFFEDAPPEAVERFAALMQKAFTLMPNLTHFQLHGSNYTEFFTSMTTNLLTTYNKVDKLKIYWGWSSPPPDGPWNNGVGGIIFPSLPPDLHIEHLRISFSALKERNLDSTEHIKPNLTDDNKNLLQSAAEPLIAAALPNARKLKVCITSYSEDINFNGVNWASVSKPSNNLEYLQYLFRNDKKCDMDVDFDAITESCPKLERLKVRTSHLNIFNGELKKEHFAKLSNCKDIELGFALQNDVDAKNFPRTNNTGAEVQLLHNGHKQSMIDLLNARRNIMEDIAPGMPALEKFRWSGIAVDKSKDYIPKAGSFLDLELAVTGGEGTNDPKKHLNFKVAMHDPQRFGV